MLAYLRLVIANCKAFSISNIDSYSRLDSEASQEHSGQAQTLTWVLTHLSPSYLVSCMVSGG